MESSQEMNPAVNVMMAAFKPDSKCINIVSVLYESMLLLSIIECKGNSILNVKAKWGNELNVEI